MTELLQAMADVLDRRIERVALPGQWRVYRDEDDRVVVEEWGARALSEAEPKATVTSDLR